MASITMAQGLNEALRYCMQRDDRVLVMGEDVGRAGGVFRVVPWLADELPQRLADTVLVTPNADEAGLYAQTTGSGRIGPIAITSDGPRILTPWHDD